MLQSSNSLQQITIVEGFTEHIFKEKGSIFTGQVFPIANSSEAKNILNGVKKKYYDATHHCYAFKCANGDSKFSDDGEPSGTAGIRLLNAITHFDLTNVLVVVIRYFGGTKLGVGPLGKAYYLSAMEALEQSKKVVKYPAQKVNLKFSFEMVNVVYKLLAEHEIKIWGTDYSESVSLSVIIKTEIIEKVKEALISATSAQLEFIIDPEILFI
ncbi:MAG: YigZ family protein [Ignavibacteria bacterium]|nr:YigZ family protein [Ignavibacteria bacterium]